MPPNDEMVAIVELKTQLHDAEKNNKYLDVIFISDEPAIISDEPAIIGWSMPRMHMN